ncbi:WD repeat-containing protein 60 [Gaertneriomyces sp. JEL0708]|nr:WD repeat-containing protein 60 [Gaertneriomyces sp. JEL0708]
MSAPKKKTSRTSAPGDDAWLDAALGKLKGETAAGSTTSLDRNPAKRERKSAPSPKGSLSNLRQLTATASRNSSASSPLKKVATSTSKQELARRNAVGSTSSLSSRRSTESLRNTKREKEISTTSDVYPPLDSLSQKVRRNQTSNNDLAKTVDLTAKVADEQLQPANAITTKLRPSGSYDDEYEEDFEEYGDDFEEFEDDPPEHSLPAQPFPVDVPGRASYSEDRPSSPKPEPIKQPGIPRHLDELQKALAEENQRVSSEVLKKEQRQAAKEVATAPKVRPSSSLPQRTLIGLDEARKEAQRRKQGGGASKHVKRAKDLESMLMLDVCAYHILDLHPLNEYELYIRSFGNSNATQSATQTNEDYVEDEQQTDHIAVKTSWTQAPPDQLVESATLGAKKKYCDDDVWAPATKGNSLRLRTFLRDASQVVEMLLDENTAGLGIPRTFTESTPLSLSQGMMPIKCPPLLKGRKLLHTCYSSAESGFLLTAWSSGADSAESASELCRRGVICVYRTTDPSTVYRMLICESEPLQCFFAPMKPYLVFAGTVDGGVLVWDLREHPSKHTSVTSTSGDAMIIRMPSYSTDGIYTLNGGHQEQICSVMPMWTSPHMRSTFRNSTGVDAAGSLPIASVDETGVLQIWSVIELRDESFTHAESDFGMALGSKIRLVRSSRFQLPSRERDLPSLLTVFDCLCHPSDQDGFLVAAGSQGILHVSRFNQRRALMNYRTTNNAMKIDDGVLTIALCPFSSEAFLAGYSSGTVALFLTSRAQPKTLWDNSKVGIRLIRWSPHRPGVFYVLDDEGTLYAWDLSESETQAAYIIYSANGPHGKAVFFALSPKSTLNTATTKHGTIAIGYEDGTLEVHMLLADLVESAIDEEKMLSALLRDPGPVDAARAPEHQTDFEEYITM